MVLSNRSPFLFFITLSGIILLVSFFIVQSDYFNHYPDIFSLAVTFDLTLFLPLLYFLIAKKFKLPIIATIPVFILSVLIASSLIPGTHQDYLDKVKYLIAPIEIFVFTYIIIKVRQSLKGYNKLKESNFDFIETLKLTLEKSIGKNKAVNILSTEISVFYYALFGWKAKPETGKDFLSFTYHKENGYLSIISVFIFLILLETFSLHILISQWSAEAAWILSALSIYGIFFLIADINSVRSRPVYVKDSSIVIRTGFRWKTELPFHEIKSFRRIGSEEIEKDKRLLNAVLIGDPNIIIELKNPLKAVGLYGIKKEYNRLAIWIDETNEFEKILQDRLVAF